MQCRNRTHAVINVDFFFFGLAAVFSFPMLGIIPHARQSTLAQLDLKGCLLGRVDCKRGRRCPIGFRFSDMPCVLPCLPQDVCCEELGISAGEGGEHGLLNRCSRIAISIYLRAAMPIR